MAPSMPGPTNRAAVEASLNHACPCGARAAADTAPAFMAAPTCSASEAVPGSAAPYWLKPRSTRPGGRNPADAASDWIRRQFVASVQEGPKASANSTGQAEACDG